MSKNGVANSHEVSWRNAVKEIDQERFADNKKLKKIKAEANESIANGHLRKISLKFLLNKV